MTISMNKRKEKQSPFVWQASSSSHMKSFLSMWYRRRSSSQTEVMRRLFWLDAIIPTPRMKSCGGILWGRGLLWFQSVHRMPGGRWARQGALGCGCYETCGLVEVAAIPVRCDQSESHSRLINTRWVIKFCYKMSAPWPRWKQKSWFEV